MQSNPFVTLGVPFGCSGDESARSFAVRARGLRRAPNGAARLQELTAALNQVDRMREDPASARRVFRIPSDPVALDPRGPGLLRPTAESLPRRSPSSEGSLRALLQAARREALSAAVAEVARTSTLPER